MTRIHEQCHECTGSGLNLVLRLGILPTSQPIHSQSYWTTVDKEGMGIWIGVWVYRKGADSWPVSRSNVAVVVMCVCVECKIKPHPRVNATKLGQADE